MAADPAKVISSALALPPRDRAKLAHELLVSLDTSSDADAADAWVSELETRAREVRSGAVAAENWETVRARLVDRWRQR
jgi:putative addiction module component (TIGR02574 family)